jgi:hypothetical protein
MFMRFQKLAAVAAVVLAAGLGSTRTASAGIVPPSLTLDTFLPGGANQNGITVGDKHYSNFEFIPTGDMILDPADIELVFAIENNTHFLAFLFDYAAMPGERSDMVIAYDVNVLNPLATINSVGLLFDGTPIEDIDGRSAATVIETITRLDGLDIVPGGDEDDDTAIITVFNNGDDHLPDNYQTTLAINPARGLRFSKDILLSSRDLSGGVDLTFVENSVTQAIIPLPAAFWAGMPILGGLVAATKFRRLTSRN